MAPTISNAAHAFGGRLGGIDHRRAAQLVGEAAQRLGGELQAGGGGPERMIAKRFPDVWIRFADGENLFVQIGRGLLSGPYAGAPVARELPAIADLVKHGTVIWVPYNWPSIWP